MAETVVRSTRLRTGTRHAFDLYRKLYRAQAMDRIAMITKGVPAVEARQWLDMPVLGRALTYEALDLPIATFNKKVKLNAKLSPAESERVVGFARLVGQVEAMVEDAGDTSEFDARTWLARWLTEPLPAFGNAKPIDFMNTMEGQTLVSQKLAQVASGAYA